ncbi:pyridoxamine 5'-phosphate oxidase family protein [Allorhizobium sp. BGMRC 0089]|uniref:pyridoxamine 5'-phosphate oxidase family protein n=1 Tax=Allorhizobium sonneratiae TaxID=2934936 RepID=UPI0020333939|nr:pyridoxamine 5'-phosphate oxidase family protein [Allorhizobium sonneratiae]MCM2290910.1 pyridoxamine 5'-phosphate oxidase family protein [Allorhizobium sonneratiae]
MVSLSEAREEPVAQLWKEIDNIHAGMLGLVGSTLPMQPMAPYGDPKTNTIWFFTRTDGELTEALRPGSRAMFCVIGKNHDYHACLSGVIEIRHDRGKIDEYWSSVVEAWFQEGKNDPALTMLALHIDDAEIWASTGNPLKFGWEIAKANTQPEKLPHVGEHHHLTFA